MSNILAAIGLAQLKRLKKIVAKREKISVWYSKRLPSPVSKEGNHWLSVAFFDTKRERDNLLKRFKKANIEARPFWKPMHLQPVFKGARVYGGEVAEALFERGVCLPSGTGMSEKDLKRIGAII